MVVVIVVAMALAMAMSMKMTMEMEMTMAIAIATAGRIKKNHSLLLQGEDMQGNKMDSNNLATLFAPNILHSMKPGDGTISPGDYKILSIQIFNIQIFKYPPFNEARRWDNITW